MYLDCKDLILLIKQNFIIDYLELNRLYENLIVTLRIVNYANLFSFYYTLNQNNTFYIE